MAAGAAMSIALAIAVAIALLPGSNDLSGDFLSRLFVTFFLFAFVDLLSVLDG